MSKTRNNEGPTIIKKYANRRLYDTGRSSYVTLEDLREMVQDGLEFVVQDAKTGEDLTHGVLTQIIADQESQGENLLPTNFLRSLIGFYGDRFQGMVPSYLEQTMSTLVKNQERLQDQITKSFEGMRTMDGIFPTPTTNMEELTRQNMELFERTMKMMSPFGIPPYGAAKTKPEDPEK